MLTHKTIRWAFIVLTLLSLVLTACRGPAPTPQTLVVTSAPEVVQVIVTAPPRVATQVVEVTPVPPTGPKTLHLNSGPGDPAALDPALAVDYDAIQFIAEMTIGLTQQNEETTAVEPGMAETWDISPDGKVYTFHIMKGVAWVRYNPTTQAVEKVKDDQGNDRLVTARDFEYGILRTLDPKTAAGYAYVLGIIAGATEFNTGTITDMAKVGVKALDDYTLEIKLTHPAAFAANILGLWVAHAQLRWIIEERGDRWTETGFQQSYGPYTLKSWNHDSDLTLIRNPFWPSLPNIPQPKIDEITFTMLDQSPAFANYQSGLLDVVSVPLSEIDRVKADPNLSKELYVAPLLGTDFWGFNTKKPPFDNVKVRLAFSEAIDRQSLIDNVLKGSQEPAQWFARPGLVAAPTLQTHPNLGVKYDPEHAKKLLDEVYPDRSKMPPVTLGIFTFEALDKMADAIRGMWKDVLGVDVQIQQQELKVYLDSLAKDAPQIWTYGGWGQDYPDANNFDRDAMRSTAQLNYTGWKNDAYDALVDQAAIETDEVKRREMYAQAEEILVKTDAVIIPLYWYTRVTMTKPYVQRTHSVIFVDHYEKWDITR